MVSTVLLLFFYTRFPRAYMESAPMDMMVSSNNSCCTV